MLILYSKSFFESKEILLQEIKMLKLWRQLRDVNHLIKNSIGKNSFTRDPDAQAMVATILSKVQYFWKKGNFRARSPDRKLVDTVDAEFQKTDYGKK